MLTLRPLLIRLLPTAVLIMLLPVVALADVPNVQSVDYQGGLLNISASGEFSSPQIEVWEGNAGPEATEIIILSFQNTLADISALQRMGEQLLLQNPDLKRFLVSPLDSYKKCRGGFQIALEVSIPAGTTLFNPTVSAGSNNQWLIALKQNADGGNISEANAIPSTAGPPSQTYSRNKTPFSASDGKTEKSFPEIGAPSPVCSIDNSTTNQRIRELEAEVFKLQAALKASQGKEEALQLQLARHDDIIRQYQPESDGTNSHEKQEMVTIQNLRLALLKLAQKLKTTEEELETQKQKTQLLTRELSSVKQESKSATSTTSSPTTLLHLADEKPLAPPAKRETKQPVKTTVYSANMMNTQSSSKLSLSATPKPPSQSQSNKTANSLPKHSAVSTVPTNQAKQPTNIRAELKTTAKPYTPSRSILSAKMAAESRIREKRLLNSLEVNPKQTQAYLDLSDLYITRGNWSAAEQMLSRLLKHNPTHKQAYYQLAWVYVYEKRKLEAQVALDTYRRLHPYDKTGIQSLQQALNSGSSPTFKQ